MGFFTGTEPDPGVPNSKCVLYFPELKRQFDLVIDSLNVTSLIPTNAVALLDNALIFVKRFSAWQTFCEFGVMFTALDNTFESISGFTTAFYRIIMQYNTVLIKVGNFTQAFNTKKCFDMARAVGEIFSIAFDFHVKEDIV